MGRARRPLHAHRTRRTPCDAPDNIHCFVCPVDHVDFLAPIEEVVEALELGGSHLTNDQLGLPLRVAADVSIRANPEDRERYAGLTLTAAATHLGVWPARISELELERRPNDELATRYRIWLNAA